jgi:hypothetical protein
VGAKKGAVHKDREGGHQVPRTRPPVELDEQTEHRKREELERPEREDQERQRQREAAREQPEA